MKKLVEILKVVMSNNENNNQSNMPSYLQQANLKKVQETIQARAVVLSGRLFEKQRFLRIDHYDMN